MKTVHPLAILSLATLVVAACGKSEQAADTTKSAAGTAVPTPTPAPTLNLADFAGTWNIVATPIDGKDTLPTQYTLTATSDATGWVMHFGSGVNVPVQITVSGDSLLEKTGQFSSQRRKNVQVWTEGSARVQGGTMTGMTTGHYSTTGADSVLHFKITGTKAP
jgi:hypothetical protein